MFGPITNVDRTIWQRQAAQALVKLLDQAAKRELPYVSWQLGAGRLLLGRFLDADMEARRAGFVAWARFLGIDDWQAIACGGGVTWLRGKSADALRGAPGLRCEVVISADVYDQSGDGGAR
jgi:hypothetical protein